MKKTKEYNDTYCAIIYNRYKWNTTQITKYKQKRNIQRGEMYYSCWYSIINQKNIFIFSRITKGLDSVSSYIFMTNTIIIDDTNNEQI